VKKKSGKKRSGSGPRAWLAKSKGRGYLAVVEGVGEAKITGDEDIGRIKELIEVRQNAAEELGKIIDDKKITTASIHNVRILGEGD
jgi:hypothetical protein